MNITPPSQSTAFIHLANPRGFCAGVDRAIDIVSRALDIFGAPVYVRHEVVHNKFVVDSLRNRGAIFVEELDEIPELDSRKWPSIVIFRAHGVSQYIRDEAKAKGFKEFDATCSLVTQVHLEVTHIRQSRRGGAVCLRPSLVYAPWRVCSTHCFPAGLDFWTSDIH